MEERFQPSFSMLIEACLGKIHRARVTQADLDYVGSITIDETLARKAGIHERQRVTITNLSNGILWYTYVKYGPGDSGTICLNGPPARHFQPGDTVIILAYGLLTPEEMEKHDFPIVFVDKDNKITGTKMDSEIVAGTIDKG